MFITKTSHLASLWNRGWSELGNGVLSHYTTQSHIHCLRSPWSAVGRRYQIEHSLEMSKGSWEQGSNNVSRVHACFHLSVKYVLLNKLWAYIGFFFKCKILTQTKPVKHFSSEELKAFLILRENNRYEWNDFVIVLYLKFWSFLFDKREW